MAKAISFNLNGHDFWHYKARDSYGSACSIFMVDQQHVEKEDFDVKLREIAGSSALIIRNHLHSHFGWAKRMSIVFDEKVDFTVNGTAFSCLYHTDRSFGRGPQDFWIDGVDVTIDQFRKGMDAAMTDCMALLYNSLAYMSEPEATHEVRRDSTHATANEPG
jgi:hypothetical protein